MHYPPRVPLTGLHVVVVASYVPAALAAQRLVAFGAAATFVLPPAGDPLAKLAPSWFEGLHERSEVVHLDLRSQVGRDALEPVLARADVLLTALRPSSLGRLGLSWQSLHGRHPRLSHVAIVGYPSPREEEPGHDLTYQAAAGLLSPPSMPRSLIADLAGAEHAALAAVSLVLGRERGGEAGCRMVSLAGAALAFAEPLRHGMTTPRGVLGGALPGYGIYRARDGWVAVGALEPHFFADLCEALGLGPDAGREELQRAFGTETMEHWDRWAAERTLPVVAVRDRPPTGAPQTI